MATRSTTCLLALHFSNHFVAASFECRLLLRTFAHSLAIQLNTTCLTTLHLNVPSCLPFSTHCLDVKQTTAQPFPVAEPRESIAVPSDHAHPLATGLLTLPPYPHRPAGTSPLGTCAMRALQMRGPSREQLSAARHRPAVILPLPVDHAHPLATGLLLTGLLTLPPC